MKEYVYKQKFKRKWWHRLFLKSKFQKLLMYECLFIGYGLLLVSQLRQHSETLQIIGDFVFQSELYETVFSKFVATGFCFALAAMYFVWHIAGAIADILTPKILAWIRRRKKSTGKDLNCCPMLECEDDGCVYFDKEHNVCKHAEVTDDV